eukprot:GILJ01010354.1.p1 GENE.GILJ01010354.1~~GILJ01010354.1.p1  ORF type:complete len:607 (-),score=103.19 GILJ01010354.1:130-1950(-)
MPRQKKNKTPAVVKSEPLSAIAWKDKGNEAFALKDYPAAIEAYTKAIEIDSAHAVLYSNRSAAYLENDQYEEAFDDAAKTLELDIQWPKAYFRRGKALQALKHWEEAEAAFQQGLRLQASNTELQTALIELQQAKTDYFDNSDNARFIKLITWLREGGAYFPKLELRHYGENYRGVHSTAKIEEDEHVLRVPLSHIVTLEMAKSSAIGQTIQDHRLPLLSPKHCFLSCLLLSERFNPDSFFKPYYDVLPSSYPTMPVFFSDDELSWLQGSPFLNSVLQKKEDIRKDYEMICEVCEEMKQYSLAEFTWARMTVASRIFGITVKGVKTDGFVPLADMLNHKRPRQTSWTFNAELQCFVIESLTTLAKGDPVLDSYGRKCNSRFFLNYGFLAEDNESNEVSIHLDLNPEDPNIRLKRVLLADLPTQRQFNIPKDLSEKSVQELFAYLRFVTMVDPDIKQIPILLQTCSEELTLENREGEPVTKRVLRVGQIPPLSIRNEMMVLEFLKQKCIELLARYPHTLEEDMALLQNPDLTTNQRNCVLMRAGEKTILHFYINLSDVASNMFQQSAKALQKKVAKKFNKSGPYDEYIQKVVLDLVLRADPLHLLHR